MPKTEALMMPFIRTRWGALIAATCHSSSVPEAFLAALTANESGGDPSARRFEAGVFKHLRAVAAGTETHFGSIVARHLNGADGEALRGLASSWGLTQIMGYHILGRAVAHADLLADPELNLHLACILLSEFAERFGLDVTKDFEEMFRCWNTGQPDGKTFDPKYVESGLRRMNKYEAMRNWVVSAVSDRRPT